MVLLTGQVYSLCDVLLLQFSILFSIVSLWVLHVKDVSYFLSLSRVYYIIPINVYNKLEEHLGSTFEPANAALNEYFAASSK